VPLNGQLERFFLDICVQALALARTNAWSNISSPLRTTKDVRVRAYCAHKNQRTGTGAALSLLPRDN
jgi:hypothetical protein